MRQFQVVAVGGTDSILAGKHALIAFKQQRFGFGVFLLSRETFAQQALGAVSLPIIRLDLLLRYSQLTQVFGRLLYEKRLREEELRGLREDKLKSIRSFAKFLAEDAA